MKAFVLASISCLVLLLGLQANAGLSCMDDHEEAAATVLKNAIYTSATSILAKKGITIQKNEDGDVISVTADQVNFQYDGVYAYFDVFISVATTKGTKILITPAYESDWLNDQGKTYRLYYKPVRKSSGMDNEGNPIAAHCTLVLDGVRVDDKANTITIKNDKTNVVLGRVSIPSKLTLY